MLGAFPAHAAKGLALASEADESTTGHASLMLIDPDVNPVLISLEPGQSADLIALR